MNPIESPSPSRRRSRFYLLTLLIIFTAVWFSNLEYRKLVRPDEGTLCRDRAGNGPVRRLDYPPAE